MNIRTHDNIENPFKDDMTGRVLLGRYRIVRKLASGGMGVVYLARTEGARGFVKPVVVKLILPTFSSDESFLKMFVREAQILSKLNDPGIVSVIDFEQEKNFYIMVLEYVHGFQLREWVKYREFKRQPLPTDLVIEIILKVLEPLHHAHTLKNEDGNLLGIVHQDISPSNIMINTDGRIKLLDFGIARVLESNEDGSTTVGSGGFQGKLSYAAPERFSGKPATIKCDLYSAGVVLHQLLVGRNEFFAKSHANTIAQVLHHRPSAVAKKRKDAPPELDMVIQRALAKNPQDRFETALEFADALRPFLKTDSRIIDEKIAELVTADFTEEMADLLGVEPLDLREKAWRKPSFPPPAATDAQENTRLVSGQEMEELLDAHSPFAVQDTDKDAFFPEETVSLKPQPHSPGMELPIRQLRTQKESDQRVPSPPLVVDTHPPPPRMVSVTGLIAIVVVVLLAAGAVIFFLTRTIPQKQNRIVLVQSSVADDISDNPTHSGVSLTAPAAAQTSDTEPGPVSEKKRTRQTTPGAKIRPAQNNNRTLEQKRLLELTSAFKKQKGKVTACFSQHASTLANTKQVSFIFSVNADGAVQKVELQPGSLSGTALGNCVRKVAQSIKFPRQPTAITFTIPVGVKL